MCYKHTFDSSFYSTFVTFNQVADCTKSLRESPFCRQKGHRVSKTILDDGFQSHLTTGAFLVGAPGIPMLMDLQNTQIPKGLIPFAKIRTCSDKHKYVHFYMHDKEFSRVLTATTRYLEDLKLYDGVITPDCSLLINQAPCLQQANTYMNRAVGFFLQKNGIPVIPNIRWSDESSFDYCFLGVPKHSIVCISTHGCICTKAQRHMFQLGMRAMLEELEPSSVLIHGRMPDDIFGEFAGTVEMHRYPSAFELTHQKRGA